MLAAIVLAAGIGAGAISRDPVCRIVYQGHLPKVEVNGSLYTPDFRLTGYDGGVNDPTYDRQALRHLADAGFRFFKMRYVLGEAYLEDGSYDFSVLEVRARHILDVVPDAFLELHVKFGNMERWCAAHPSETIQYAAGPVGAGFSDEERIGRPVRPSAASESYREESLAAVRALSEWIRGRPWGNRVVAVRPCWGIYTEWHTYGMYQGPDVGEAMKRAFKEPVPSMAERGCGATLLDPVKDRRVLAFYRLLSDEASDFLLMLARAFKKHLPGRLVGAYYGYVFTVHPPEGANAQLAKVLAAPEIDYLSCPPIYSGQTRLAGGSNMSRSVPSPFHRYGKLMLSEDDTRFHHIKGYVEQHLLTRSPEESRAVMKRNYCNKLFDGCGIQLHDPTSNDGMRPYSFDDPHVLKALTESMAAFRKTGPMPVDSGNETALVVSEREQYRRDGGKNSTTIMRLYYITPQELWRTGVSYDVVALEDYLAMPRSWKNVIFLNTFHLTDAERKALARKAKRKGTTAIWLVAPGSVTDGGFSDRAMSELTGMELSGADREPHVVCGGKVETLSARGYKAYVKALGEDARAVFIPITPEDWRGWRSLFDQLGVRADAPGGNYFRRHGDVLMFHVGSGGAYELRVPDMATGDVAVELFSGRNFASAPLKLTATAPETWLLRIFRKRK